MNEKVFLGLFEKGLYTMQRTETSVTHHVNQRIQHAILGLCNESGELLEALKARIYYDKQFDLVNLFEEAGDMWWYYMLLVDEMANLLQTTPLDIFKHIIDMNRVKLNHRYKDGEYSEEQARVRDKDAEHKAMQKVVWDLTGRKDRFNEEKRKEIKTKVKKKRYRPEDETE